MNRRRPYHLVHPLRGCGDTRGNALGYRYASPNGDKGCNQHLGARNISATTPPRWEDYGHTVFTAPPPQCDGATTTLHSPLSTLHSSQTFSAKERDSETGLSYFGARYYSSDLSIWLSVDPMSDKYPSLSPYVYCADNPVKLVDPNGEDVFICGASSDSESDAKAAEKAFKYFAGSVKNLSLERDSKTGKLSATIKEGTQLSENEQKIYNAIIDKEVVVNLSVSNYNLHKNRETEFGAGFYGNKLGKNASGSGYAFAFTDQFVCLPVLEQNYFSSDIGGVIR